MHVYLWVGPVWLLLLSLLFLYQHIRERSSCGASYPLAVFFVFEAEAEARCTTLLCPSDLDMHSLSSELGLEARVG